MSARRHTAIARSALLALALLAAPDARGSFALVNLGTNTFGVDAGATTADYSQTDDSLVFDGNVALGDTLGGLFAEQEWTSYDTFGLRMTLSGANPLLPFTVQFYDPDFAIINSYQGTTASLAENTVAHLSLSLPGTGNFSRVVGMQFTWDAPGAINTAMTEIVGFPAEDSGFFVARAPGGVAFLTGTNSTLPFKTTLAANATNWSPPSFAATLAAGGAAWAALCDSNAKTDISAVDHRDTLGKISSLPVATWKYRSDPRRSYIGPMAQDFHAVFHLGSDDKRIATIDTDGVTLSALKGIIEELRERQERSASQARRLAELETELRSLQDKLRGSLPPAE